MVRRRELRAITCTFALAALLGGCSVYDPILLIGQKRAGALPADAAVGDALDDAALPDKGCEPGADPPHCTRPNAQTACVKGKCLIAGCDAPHVDCDEEAANGCEATLNDIEHCGLCGAACRFSHAAASCKGGQCELADCDHGFADCDGDATNGCETALDSISDCGACRNSCSAGAHAVAGCSSGACAVASCVGTYGDCNENPRDGCEQLLTTAENCGSCHTSCTPQHADSASCASGKCVISKCTNGFFDCNGKAADGCEATLKTPDNCGGCGAKCSLPHVTRTTCDLATGAAKCGIDHDCSPGQEGCVAGALTNGCTAGFSDCDQNPANGCETDLSRAASCGECNRTCVLEHSLRECRLGTCVTRGCTAGYAQCGTTRSCQSLLNDPNNCGECGRRCSGTTPNCSGGKCTASTCQPGSADCDGNANNTCETNLNDAANCGGCGASCAQLPHSTGACRNGSCVPNSCETGFGDCDNDPTNGCETDLRTLNDCGKCGTVCAFPNAEAECRDGRCQLRVCNDKRADCNRNLDDGCEADLALPVTCGGCANLCTMLPGVISSSCQAGGCDLICEMGHANCDGRPDNGCEASLSDGRTCGGCNNDCGRLPHVTSAECSAGVCEKLNCDAGFADCNGNPADGCERSTRTLTDCGACNQACAPAHATGACTSGQCQPVTCDRGFADCDAKPQNGCEAALSSPDHCGSCTNACAGTTRSCVNGSCGCSTDAECPAKTACCEGRCLDNTGICNFWPCIPGIETPGDFLNCGGCGRVCVTTFCCSPVPLQ